MAAPAIRYVKSNTSNSATITSDGDATTTQAAVGDLCVITREGVQASTGTDTAPTYTTGGADAGFSGVALTNNGNSNGRAHTWAKILVSGDFSGSNLKGFSYSLSQWTGTRTQVWIVRDGDGAGWNGLGSTIVSSTANVASPATYSLTGPSPDAPCIFFALFASGSGGGTTQQFTWDSGTIRDPYCDDGSGTDTGGAHGNHYATGLGAAQSDYQEYALADTPSQIVYAAGTANTTHATQVVRFTAAVASTGTAAISGGGTVAVAGTPTVLGTPGIVGGGSFTLNGTRTTFGTVAISGGGTIHAQQGGVKTGTISVAGGGTVAASGASSKVGTITVDGGGLFSVEGISGAIEVAEGGEWSAGSLQLANQTWTNATAATPLGGTIALVGQKVSHGAGLLRISGGGGVATAGARAVQGSITITIAAVADFAPEVVTGYRATINERSNATTELDS